MKEFTHRIATYEDIPTIKVLMELSINRLLGPLLSVEQLEASSLHAEYASDSIN